MHFSTAPRDDDDEDSETNLMAPNAVPPLLDLSGKEGGVNTQTCSLTTVMRAASATPDVTAPLVRDDGGFGQRKRRKRHRRPKEAMREGALNGGPGGGEGGGGGASAVFHPSHMVVGAVPHGCSSRAEMEVEAAESAAEPLHGQPEAADPYDSEGSPDGPGGGEGGSESGNVKLAMIVCSPRLSARHDCLLASLVCSP